MQPLNDALLLDIWARRDARGGDDCADLLASACGPGDAQLDEWPLARCQAALLELRCATFGPTIEAAMDCPECGARLEFELDGEALLTFQRDGSADGADAPALCVQGLGFRLPTRRDLLAVSGPGNEHDAVVALARACCSGDPARVEWTEALLEALDAAFEAADPLSNLQLSLACPDCRRVWDQPLDLPRYFREEIDVRARVLLVEVHRLARAYGWSERDILAMAPARRKAYLELLA